jgi:hypothetical protein
MLDIVEKTDNQKVNIGDFAATVMEAYSRLLKRISHFTGIIDMISQTNCRDHLMRISKILKSYKD